MPDAATLQRRLQRGPPLLLDGPMGTELERRGLGVEGRLWSARAVLERPDAVRTLHEEYALAGADVLTTATFRTNPSVFHAAGYGERSWREAVHSAVGLALAGRAAARREVWVAGSLAPIGDCYSPDEVPEDDARIDDEHGRHAAALCEAGVDLLLVETMNTVREAVLAVRAARRTGLPVWVSFVVQPGARLLSGEPVDEALVALGGTGVDAVLVNCCTVGAVEDAAEVLRRGDLPWGAYANAATRTPHPGMMPGPEVPIDAYLPAARGWLGLGADVVGSCCGTGPAFTAALRRLLDTLAAPAPGR